MTRRREQLALQCCMEADVESDLRNVEARLGVRLPSSVRSVYAFAGGRLLRRLPGLTADYARLRFYRETADFLLRDSKADYRLAPSDVVFWADDYQFFFFSCEEGDNPPVHRFVEGERQPREVAASFTEWVARVR